MCVPIPSNAPLRYSSLNLACALQLGYVGGSYTKRSAADRKEFEATQQNMKTSSNAYMQLPEDLAVLSAPARSRLAQP